MTRIDEILNLINVWRTSVQNLTVFHSLIEMRTFFPWFQLTQIVKVFLFRCKLYLVLFDILVHGLVVKDAGGEGIDMMDWVGFFGVDKNPVVVG